MAWVRGRLAQVVSAPLLLIALQGCVEEGTSTDPAPRPEAPARAGTTACLARERGAAADVADTLQQAINPVIGSRTGSSVRAGRGVTAGVEQAEKTVLQRCDQPSAAMRTFKQVTRHGSSDGLSLDDLDAVVSAYAAWGRSVGAENVTRSVRSAFSTCRTLKDRLGTSYRTWWRWSGAGREWWVELTFHNELPRTLHASLWGHARVTTRPESSSSGRDRGASIMQWGASSWDYATIPPGTSRHVLPLGADYEYRYVPTGPSGTLRVLDAGLSIQSDVAGFCILPPIQEAS